MPDNDPLDLLIDSALKNYADPGLDSGLEQRVLDAVRARMSPKKKTARRLRWLPSALALPVATCLLLYFVSTPKKTHLPPRSADQARQAHEPAVESANNHPALRTGLPPKGKRPIPKAQPRTVNLALNPAPPPKLDVFPTPRPLTQEEQALVIIANQTPKPVLEALILAQEQDEAPVAIAAIHIPPLDPPEPDGN